MSGICLADIRHYTFSSTVLERIIDYTFQYNCKQNPTQFPFFQQHPYVAV